MPDLSVDYPSEIIKSGYPKYKMPSDPAEAIFNANLRGIASIRRLAVNRVTNQTRHIFQSIDRQWKNAKQKWYESRREKAYDFSIITRAEANIRKMYLRMIFENTQKYGNEVSIRIYDGLGDRDLLNGLFNMAGYMMRAFSVKYYPFPTPEKNNNQFGYTHEKYGFIPINHVNNPSLDFIDVIRSHVNELCRQMFIHKISRNNSRKYTMQLLHRSVPFLDWLYQGGKRGKKWDGKYNSITQMDKILRDVITSVEKDVSYKSHHVKVTHQKKHDGKAQLTRLKKGKKEINPYHGQFLTNQFYGELNVNISRLKQRVGSLSHDKMAMGLAQPYNLRDVILYGDRYSQKIKLYEEDAKYSDYIIVAELPLWGNQLSGKADYVIFKKEGKKGKFFWKPVAVLDLKTKQAIDWEIGSRTNKNNQMIPYPRIRRREMKKDEWKLKFVLDDARDQLNNYARILNKNYKTITGEYGRKLIRGVIVLDPSQEVKLDKPTLVQKMLYSFIYTLDDEKKELGELLSESPRIFELNDYKDTRDNPLRLAIIIDRHCYSFGWDSIPSLLSDKIKVNIPKYSPLGNPSKNITLYLTGASQVNFGNIAAWIAAHYHLMSELQSKHEEIIILDLLSMLDNFTELRLRIDRYIDLDRFIILQYDPNMEFLVDIKEQPVIITGWIEFEEMHGRYAYIIKNRIIDRINSDEIYVISSPIRDVPTSSKYEMRTYLPFSYNQMDNVSEIVWNLPVAPLQTMAPKYDNIRVIIKQKEDTIDLVEIKPLRHLSRKFNQNRKKKSRSTSIPLNYFDEEKPKKKENPEEEKKRKLKEEKKRKEEEQIKYDAYELIPWFKDKKDAIPIEYLYHYRLPDKDQRIHTTSFNQRSKIRVDAKLNTRQSYSMRSSSTKHSYLPPKISELVESSEITNFNKKVSNYLGKKMIGSVNLHNHLHNITALYKQKNFETEKYIQQNLQSYERNYPVSGVLEQSKQEFYRNHVDKWLLSFEEFKTKSYWLDMILIMIHELNPKIKDDDLIRFWQYYSPWLLYSLGYDGNSTFNIYFIWKQINRKVRKIDTEYMIDPILHGTMYQSEQHSIINFGSRFHGIVSNLNDPFGKQWVVRDKHLADKIIKKRSDSSIPLVITRIGEFEYLWKEEEDWILVGRIYYRLGSQLEYLKLYPSILDVDLNIEHEDPMPQIVKKIIQTTCDLEFDGEERIKLIVSSEDGTFNENEYLYSDLNRLIHDLRAGTRSELELEVDEKKHTVGWDKYRGIYWGDLGKLRGVVNQYRSEIQNKFMEDLPESIELLHIDIFEMGEEEEDTLELSVYHIDDICPLRDITYEEASKYPDHDKLWHGDCWGLRCHDYELDHLLDIAGLYGVKNAFSGFDLLNLYNQEYIVWGEIKYNLKFDFDLDDDSSIYQENMGTIILFGKVYNTFMTKMLPLTHKLDDLYRIVEVELGKNNMVVTLQSIRTGDYKHPNYYVYGDLICDRYRDFGNDIDTILSSNMVKVFCLTDTDWNYKFNKIKTRISDHQESCECASTPCNVFEGLKLSYLDDDEYEIEFRAYMVASNNVVIYGTIELDTHGVFHLGLDYLEEYTDLIQKFGWGYEHMDRDLFYHVTSKFGDIETICTHEHLLSGYKGKVEEVTLYARELIDHKSIKDKDRFKFMELDDYIEFVSKEYEA